MALAKQLTIGAAGVDSELFARVRRHYDEGQIVEITAMAGLFNYLNRASEFFQVSPTKPGEGLE